MRPTEIVVLDAKVTKLGNHKIRKYYKIYSHPLVEEWFYYSQCVCNEMDALIRRHYNPFNLDYYLSYNHIGTIYNKLHNIRMSLAKELGSFYSNIEPHSYDKIIKSLRSGIRKRYQLAYNSIVKKRAYLFEMGKRTTTSAFVKWEKMHFTKHPFVDNKPARLIQHRSYEFTLMQKTIIQPLVDADKEITERFYHQPFNTIRTSGMNQNEMAELLYKEWNSFYRPCAILLDCSNFDGHIDYFQLKLENEVVKHAYGGMESNYLDRLLTSLYFNKGFTHHGVKFKGDGCRNSGDASTAKGNSDINHINLRTLIIYIKQKYNISFRHILHVHGDDSVIIADYNDVQLLAPHIKILMEHLGHNVKFEIVTDFEKISYCQCQPVNINNKWKMVREPIRVISRGAYVDKLYPWNKYFAAIGLCELAVHSGVPILQSLAISNLMQSGLEKPLRTLKKDFTFSGTSPNIQPISEETRWSFYRAFDITPLEQKNIESSMASDSNKNFAEVLNYINKNKDFVRKLSQIKVL